MFNHLSFCLYIYLTVYISIWLSVSLFIHLSVYPSICLSIYLSIPPTNSPYNDTCPNLVAYYSPQSSERREPRRAAAPCGQDWPPGPRSCRPCTRSQRARAPRGPRSSGWPGRPGSRIGPLDSRLSLGFDLKKKTIIAFSKRQKK